MRGFPYQEWLNNFQEYPQSQIYYRRSFEDIYVVSYNPEFLKLMKTHTNVQIVSSENIAVYLSKYIRWFSIWPFAFISICCVSVISSFRANSKSSFWPEELISSGLKLCLPASKRHMLYSSLQFPFGSKKVHFRPESGQDQHQQPKTHDLKFEETVKDGGQIDLHLILH